MKYAMIYLLPLLRRDCFFFMDKDQELLEISKLVFKLSRVGSTGADLDKLLRRLFDILEGIAALRVVAKGAILLFNPRHELIQVAQHGLGNGLSSPASGRELDGVRPHFRPEVRLSTLREERAGPGAGADGRFFVLPLVEEETPIGEVLIFIEPDWQPDEVALEFMADLAGALSGMVSRCLVNEILQVRETELHEARTDAIRRLGKASEYRDNETGMHIMRMTHFAGAIAKVMGLPEDVRETLLIAAPMHDVGKIGIADAILMKPGRLTPDEFDIMKQHTEIGGGLLTGDDALILAAQEIAMTHHEHWDGSGYPRGLAGEDIPLSGRICSVADVFDALTSARPYKEAWSVERAVALIEEESGRKFDPRVVAAFLQALPEILRIRHLYREDILDPNQVIDLPEPAVSAATPFVEWTDELSIGIDVIDMHHRYLLDLINDLYGVVTRKLGAKQVFRVLKRLGDYTKVHFRAEEDMMEHYGYGAIAGQRESHNLFEGKIKAFQEELRINPLTAQVEMLAYLRDWLIGHILHEDVKLRILVAA